MRRENTNLENKGEKLKAPWIAILIIASMIGAIGFLINTNNNLGMWQQVEGTVIDTDIEYNGDTSAAIITYSYMVDGKNYTSDRFTSFEALTKERVYVSDYEEVFDRLDMYPIGKTILIYYRPNNPSTACIKPLTLPFYISLIVILSLILVDVIVETAIKKNKEMQESSQKNHGKWNDEENEEGSNKCRESEFSNYDTYDDEEEEEEDTFGDYQDSDFSASDFIDVHDSEFDNEQDSDFEDGQDSDTA